MKTSNLTIAVVFAASMAWANVAGAEQPCGVSIDRFESCQIVEAPNCDDTCEPGAMVVACNGKGSADFGGDELELSFADYQEGSRRSRGGGWEDYYKRCKKRHKRDWKRYCKKRDEWRKDYFESCKRKYGNKWRKYCKKWWDDQTAGFDVDAHDQTAEQAEASPLCASQMADSCAEHCSTGAVLQCDGQYLSVDDIGACVAELEQRGIAVDDPSAAPSDGEIVTDALQGASCAVQQPSKLGILGGLFGLLGLGLGAGVLRRRRS